METAAATAHVARVLINPLRLCRKSLAMFVRNFVRDVVAQHFVRARVTNHQLGPEGRSNVKQLPQNALKFFLRGRVLGQRSNAA